MKQILYLLFASVILSSLNAQEYEMVFVKGGTIKMGCTREQKDCDKDEKPIQRITISDFYIGKYEVTQNQWREVMGRNPSNFKACDSCPVEMVSWKEVQVFIGKLNEKTGKNYRLPTEAEWEYAARGGEGNVKKKYPYAGSKNVDEVAWYKKNAHYKTHPVGQKKGNDLGIYDMSGNVWEWCSDRYSEYSKGNQINPQGPSEGSSRVVRGGAYNFQARYCRVADRLYRKERSGDQYIGFRLALTL